MEGASCPRRADPCPGFCFDCILQIWSGRQPNNVEAQAAFPAHVDLPPPLLNVLFLAQKSTCSGIVHAKPEPPELANRERISGSCNEQTDGGVSLGGP